MITVNPSFAEELARFGVDTALDCFHCGTCAAICPLIYEHFPTKADSIYPVGRQGKDPGRPD